MVHAKQKIARLFILSSALFLTACPGGLMPGKDDGSDKPPAIALKNAGQVYIAGYSTGIIRAYYWIDGTLQTIAEADQGVTTQAVSVVPTNLGDYVAGARTDFVDPILIQRAIIWFNGHGEFLDEAPSYALSAMLHEGKILVAGWRHPDGSSVRPCWWELSDTWTLAGGEYAVGSRSIVRHDLPTDDRDGQTRDIAASGAEVYACGYYQDGAAKQACYWKNGVRTDLDGGTMAEALRVHEGSVYVGGSSASGARYWIDGAGHNLAGFPAGSSDAIVNAIAINEAGLFLGGSYYKGDYLGFSWHEDTLTPSLPRVIGAGARETEFYLGCEDGWFKGGSYTALPWIGGTLRPRGIRMRLY